LGRLGKEKLTVLTNRGGMVARHFLKSVSRRANLFRFHVATENAYADALTLKRKE
jgi:hypothetical protein